MIITMMMMMSIDDDDELIPTAIVIKNIPFAIKKEQLLDVMTELELDDCHMLSIIILIMVFSEV